MNETPREPTTRACGPYFVYQLGPFTSKTYATQAAAQAQGTRHAKRGLSAEFYRRQAARAAQKRETTR